MAKYLDPKADLTFKKVFGEHKHLVISLLNALLPLGDDERVESIEYWPADKIPDRVSTQRTFEEEVKQKAKEEAQKEAKEWAKEWAKEMMKKAEVKAEQQKLDTACKLKAMNVMTAEQIADATGLTIKEIEAL